MGYLLAYSIKTAILLTVLFAIYTVTAGRIKGASFRRAILIGIYVAVVFIPLFDFNIFRAETAGAISGAADMAATQSSVSDSSTLHSIYHAVALVTTTGMILLLLHLLMTFLYVAYLRVKGRHTVVDGIDITVIERGKFSPFCFGNRMFISETEFNEMADMVFCHEKSHIYRSHFLDLLFARLVTIMQWWNPAGWLMQRELHDVHEFQADEDVVNEGYPLREYQYLLLSRAAGRSISDPIPSHGIRRSRLHHRLQMMNKTRSSRFRAASSILLLPAMAVAIMIISSPLLSPVLLSATRVSGNIIWIPSSDKSSQPDYTVDGKPVTAKYIEQLSPDMIKAISIRKDSPEHPDGLVDIELKTPQIPDLPAHEPEPDVTTLDEIMVVARAKTYKIDQ